MVLYMIYMCTIPKSILHKQTFHICSYLVKCDLNLKHFFFLKCFFSIFCREIALEILQQEDIGSFIVRDSTTHPGCYALSVRVPKYDNPTGISHYLILKTQRGVKLKVSYSSSHRRYIVHWGEVTNVAFLSHEVSQSTRGGKMSVMPLPNVTAN